MVAVDIVHQSVDVGLSLFRGDAERGTAEQRSKNLLHEDVERADGVLQHTVTRLGMKFVLEGMDVVQHIIVRHHHALGLTRRTTGVEDIGESLTPNPSPSGEGSG